jgi:hypothetical protein
LITGVAFTQDKTQAKKKCGKECCKGKECSKKDCDDKSSKEGKSAGTAKKA